MKGLILLLVFVLAHPAGASTETAPGDSLIVDLPDIVVSGEGAPAVSVDRSVVDAAAIERLDPGSLADLGAVPVSYTHLTLPTITE